VSGTATGWVERVRAELAAAGLNAWGVADGARHQAVLPGCRSVLVFGNGGTRLWDRFLDELRRDPRRLGDEEHPLDAFVRRALDRADPDPPPSRRWIRCAADEPEPVDFRTLGLEAGLGWPSMLGLALHPTFGPWLAFRAACFTTEPLPASGPLGGPGPCDGCAAPCVSACPARAVERAGGWNVRVCAAWNVRTDVCASSCASRVACPVGEAHRYSALERQYHYDRKTGRRALAASLGVADARTGVGPHWKDWIGVP
jgi:hypothetical protein